MRKEADAGRRVADVCREYGISQGTLYRWTSKYSGLEVSEAKRLHELEDENRRPKTLVAELSLEILRFHSVDERAGVPSRRRGAFELPTALRAAEIAGRDQSSSVCTGWHTHPAAVGPGEMG